MNLSLLLRIFYFQYIKRKIIPEIPVIKIQSGDILQTKFIDLIDHPEGGRFHIVFRSDRTVTTDKGDTRSALTHIYFSLEHGEVSKFHKVESDEVWNLYQGSGLNLYIWDGTDKPPECITLSAESNNFCHVVSADVWQAAEPVSDTVLAGCSVAPGFEFEDFELIDRNSEESERLLLIAPGMEKYI